MERRLGAPYGPHAGTAGHWRDCARGRGSLPELVTTWGDEGYKAVAYEKLTGVLITAVKELTAATDTQQQHIAALEARLAALERTAETRQPARDGCPSPACQTAGRSLGGCFWSGWFSD